MSPTNGTRAGGLPSERKPVRSKCAGAYGAIAARAGIEPEAADRLLIVCKALDLVSEQARRFPLHLTSNQPATRLHSQLDCGSASQASKVSGREPVLLHPDDARERGITDGDVVRVFNDRGACLADNFCRFAVQSRRNLPAEAEEGTGDS